MSSILAATKAVARAEDAVADARNAWIPIAGLTPLESVAACKELYAAREQVRRIAAGNIQPQESP